MNFIYHGHGTSWSGKVILSVENVLACKKTPVRIHLQSGSTLYPAPGNQSKFSHRKRLYSKKFVTSHQQRPRNIISSPGLRIFWIRRQRFRGHPVWPPVREAGRPAGPAKWFSPVLLPPPRRFSFRICRRPWQWTVRKKQSSERKPAKGRGKVLLCLSLLFLPSAAHSQKAGFYSLSATRGRFHISRIRFALAVLDVYLCSFTSIEKAWSSAPPPHGEMKLGNILRNLHANRKQKHMSIPSSDLIRSKSLVTTELDFLGDITIINV